MTIPQGDARRKLKLSKEARRLLAEEQRALFFALLKAYELPIPTTEARFHHRRKWRFDFCWSDDRLALEVEGGAWTNGRHNRGAGFIADMEKYNAAAVMGWRLLRVTPKQLTDLLTVKMIGEALNFSSETADV